MAQTTSRRCINPSVPNTDTLANSTSEQYFSKKLKIPARELSNGFMLKYGTLAKHTATNSTDTSRLRLYLGTGQDNTGLLIGDTGAVDCANDDVSAIDGWAKCGVAGGASTGVLHGKYDAVAKATAKSAGFDSTEAQLDFTADMYLTASMTYSVADPGNVSRLDDLWCEVCPYELTL